MSIRSSTTPNFFDPSHAASWNYSPDAAAVLASAGHERDLRSISPAQEDECSTLLLIIDAQRDFCHPRGSLFVAGRSGAGATDDAARLCSFIYRNPEHFTAIDCTLDTHHPFQIFFAPFWEIEDGEQPQPYREITADEVASGSVRPRADLLDVVTDGINKFDDHDQVGAFDVDWLQRQALDYCRKLEREGRYRLYLWPLHCLAGGDGHALLGVIQEARLFHTFLRDADSRLEFKGSHPLTENYSVLRPEVLQRHDGKPMAAVNLEYLERLLSFDRIVIAGQAASHCVRFTVDDLLDLGKQRGLDMAKRLVLLEDCMSAVTVPNPNKPGELLVDFTDEVERAFDQYRNLGIHVCKSTTSPNTWPTV